MILFPFISSPRCLFTFSARDDLVEPIVNQGIFVRTKEFMKNSFVALTSIFLRLRFARDNHTCTLAVTPVSKNDLAYLNHTRNCMKTNFQCTFAKPKFIKITLQNYYFCLVSPAREDISSRSSSRLLECSRLTRKIYQKNVSPLTLIFGEYAGDTSKNVGRHVTGCIVEVEVRRQNARVRRSRPDARLPPAGRAGPSSRCPAPTG